MNLDFSAIREDFKKVQFGCGGFNFNDYKISMNSLKSDLGLLSSYDSSCASKLSSEIDKFLEHLQILTNYANDWCNNITEVMYMASFVNSDIDAFDNLMWYENKKEEKNEITDELIIELTYMLSNGIFGKDENTQVDAFMQMGFSKGFYDIIKENLEKNESNSLKHLSDFKCKVNWVEPPDEILNTRIYTDYLCNSKYFNLVSNIKNSDSYNNYNADSDEKLNTKVKALANVYNYSQEQLNYLFAIVDIEGIAQGNRSNEDIYKEAVNVTSSILNRANSVGAYYGPGVDTSDPLKIIQTRGFDGDLQYSATLDKRWNYIYNGNYSRVVEQAVCDVLLSGIPSHNYDSYGGREYLTNVANINGDYILDDGGNGYYNSQARKEILERNGN